MAAPRKRSRPSQSKSKSKAKETVEIVSDEDCELIESECDEEIPLSDNDRDQKGGYSSDEETADEKRVRLAKEYLSRVEHLNNKDSDNEDNTEGEEDRTKKFLIDAARSAKGTLHRRIASSIGEIKTTIYRGHKSSATSVSLSGDDSRAISCSKDGSWIFWDIASGKKLSVTQEPDELLAACFCSADGNLVATGGRDKVLRLWDVRTPVKPIQKFVHHRDAITSLAWRRNSPHLFSGSSDRTIKIWDVEARAYSDTLFGHQAAITSLSSLNSERVLSAALDGTVRLFKIAEQTQLVYRNRSSNIDGVAMLSESQFISGDQSGTLAVFRAVKKKPALTATEAHGRHWINAIQACPFTDLAASGASDGFLRFWRVSPEQIVQVGAAAVAGFVNGIAMARSGRFAVCAVGQEPRLGRWSVDKAGRNGIHICSFQQHVDSDQQ